MAAPHWLLQILWGLLKVFEQEASPPAPLRRGGGWPRRVYFLRREPIARGFRAAGPLATKWRGVARKARRGEVDALYFKVFKIPLSFVIIQ